MHELTVITATYNVVKAGRAEMLERCVRSVAALKTPHEHLIMDGASTDGTLDILKRLERECEDVRVVSEPDAGLYDALNKGVRAAKGKWIYVLGCDDYIFAPAVMDDVVKEADTTDADMVISQVRRSDGVQAFKSVDDFRCCLTVMPYSHQATLMSKDLMLRLNGFDERFRISGDFDICLRAHMMNAKEHIIWKQYANFEAGGMSLFSEKVHDDMVAVTSSVLGLTADEKSRFRKKRLLPLRVLLRLLFHRNWIVRKAALHAIKRRVANICGMLDGDGQPKGVFKRM